MSDSKTVKNSGSARLVVLAALVVAVGLGAWYMMKKPIVDPTAVVETSLLPETGDAEIDQAPVTEETSTPSEASTPIDVSKAMGVRAVGDINAPIKIIEYASLTCSHCAHFHNDVYPALKSKYIDTGKVYFEFREFPLNDPALKATIAARCLPEAQYEGFISALFKGQAQWAEDLDYMKHIKQNAKLAGLSDEQFEACQANPALKMKIAENMQTAQDKWKIAATPTFIINDGAKTISGAQPLENFEAVFRELTNNAVGEAPAVE